MRKDQSIAEMATSFLEYFSEYRGTKLNFEKINLTKSEKPKYYFYIDAQILSSERSSLGQTYNERSYILFLIYIYTQKQNNTDSAEHQKSTAYMMDFFSHFKPSLSSRAGQTIVTGPELYEGFLLSTVSNQFQVNEQIV